MKLSRRNTIIGLGAVVGGAGVITATGAFDAVEANRDFNVDVAGDAAALLGLEVHNDAIAGTEAGGAGDNDVIYFELDDGEVGESALNEDAETKFFSVFTITNNGAQDIEVSIDTGDVNGVSFPILKEPNRQPDDVTNENVINGDLDLETDGVALAAGQTVSVDLTIDTREGGYVAPDDDPYEMTLTALSSDAQ